VISAILQNREDRKMLNHPIERSFILIVCAVGAFVDYHAGGWTTRRLLAAKPKPGMAMLKGAGYGAIQGAVTLSTGFIVAFVLGHYMETIKFNKEGITVIKLIGMATLGGSLYGGLIGAAGGAAYGPGISFYMKF